MSFDGYYQILCRNGHRSGADCYDDPNFNGTGPAYRDENIDPLWRCPECNEVAAWWNLVNTTNGSYYENERIDGYIELERATTPEICTCSCGHKHAKNGELSTYHIPESGGHIVNGGLIESEKKHGEAESSERNRSKIRGEEV
jgi:hypothetical protein